MSLIAAALRELIAAGLSGEDLVSAVARIEAETHPAVKTARQERNARYYASKASEKRLNKTNSDDQDVSDPAAEPSFPLERKVSPCTPSKETNPLPSTPSASPQALSGRERDFADFWKAYPRKIGKDAAAKAFSKAMDRTAGLAVAVLIEAIRRYERFKPPDIDFCHPATWLNGGRWNDEWTSGSGGSGASGNPGIRPAKRGYDAVAAGLGNYANSRFGGRDDDPGTAGFDRGGTVVSLPAPRRA